MATQKELCKISKEGVTSIKDISENAVSWLDVQKCLFHWASVSHSHEHAPTSMFAFITCHMVPHGGCLPSVTIAQASKCSIHFGYY